MIGPKSIIDSRLALDNDLRCRKHMDFGFGMMFLSSVQAEIYVYVSVWLAQLVKALAALTHVCSCVQEVRVRSPEQTSSTLASIPPG